MIKKTALNKNLKRHHSTSLPYNFVMAIVLCLLLAPFLFACGENTSTNGTAGPASSAASTGSSSSAAATTSSAAATTSSAVATTSGSTTTASGAVTTSDAATTGASGTNAASSGVSPNVTNQALAQPVTTTVTAGATSGTSQSQSSSNTGSITPTNNLEVDIQNVVKVVSPSVVFIAVQGTQQGQTFQAAGTGSIISADGYILTNNHVVDGATTITVLVGNQEYPAQVSGTAKNNDLAVIKIDASNLPAIKMGSSGALKVGEWVVAIGNALALPGGPTVTAGIVGALGRTFTEDTGALLSDVVQTNAQINPGNSGGPLLNLSGELVGINTAAPIDPESQTAAQGIGYAISIDEAKPIIQSLVKGQSIYPPYMGAVLQDLTAGLAARYSMSATSGVIIRQIVKGSPAEAAGWTAGEIITGMDNTQVTDLASLQAILARHKPGDTVQVSLVNAQNKTVQTNITFSQPPVTNGNSGG